MEVHIHRSSYTTLHRAFNSAKEKSICIISCIRKKRKKRTSTLSLKVSLGFFIIMHGCMYTTSEPTTKEYLVAVFLETIRWLGCNYSYGFSLIPIQSILYSAVGVVYTYRTYLHKIATLPQPYHSYSTHKMECGSTTFFSCNSNRVYLNWKKKYYNNMRIHTDTNI